MKKTFLLIVLFNIFLVSCQQIEKKSSAILEKEQALEKWIGQPKSELLEVYGLPTQVRKDDQGIELMSQALIGVNEIIKKTTPATSTAQSASAGVYFIPKQTP